MSPLHSLWTVDFNTHPHIPPTHTNFKKDILVIILDALSLYLSFKVERVGFIKLNKFELQHVRLRTKNFFNANFKKSHP